MARKKKNNGEVTDLELVEQFKKGSIDAFEEIVLRYQTKAYNLAMKFCRNQEDAEEVLQDVFSTLYRKIEGFRGQSAFSSWVYRIIVNASFMKLRKRKQNRCISIEDLSPVVRQSVMEKDDSVNDKTDSFTLNRELRGVLQGAINRLPEQYRAVFVLRDVDGLSNQEVSEILALSIPAVKSRLHRSRLMLRKKLQRYYDDYTGTAPAMNIIPDNIELVENI